MRPLQITGFRLQRNTGLFTLQPGTCNGYFACNFHLFYYLSPLITPIMAYWLGKSEPSVYSWEQFEKDKQTFWDGVRNYAARNHLKAMKKGDEVLYYHSNEGLEIVGIAKVAKEFHQDPTTTEDAWVAVDIKPYKRLKNPVSLEQIKKEK